MGPTMSLCLCGIVGGRKSSRSKRRMGLVLNTIPFTQYKAEPPAVTSRYCFFISQSMVMNNALTISAYAYV